MKREKETVIEPSDMGRYIVEAADAALILLNLIAEHPGLKLTEISARAHFNKSRTMRLLITLEYHRMIARGSDGSYFLGIQSLVLGSRAESQIDIAKIVQPRLDALRDLTGETCQFRIRSGLRSICVAKSDSHHSIRAHTAIGEPRELYVGSAKVILAFAEPALVEKVIKEGLHAFTPNTFADPKALQSELNRIKNRGYSISRGERLEGALALGAPVRDQTGEVIGCVALLGPENRIEPAIDSNIKEMLKVARELTRDLGGRVCDL